MPTHAERRRLPFSAEQLYKLVADVESYPKFLPWCVATRIRQRHQEGDAVVELSDMVIGFKMLREKYTSRVTLREGRIDVEYVEGPFKYLTNHWIFEQQPDGGCVIDFYIDFEFRSKMLQKIMGGLFNEAVKLMVGAFERRARQIYGESALTNR
jgi:coenzyme Q-binding protein COQ10